MQDNVITPHCTSQLEFFHQFPEQNTPVNVMLNIDILKVEVRHDHIARLAFCPFFLLASGPPGTHSLPYLLVAVTAISGAGHCSGWRILTP